MRQGRESLHSLDLYLSCWGSELRPVPDLSASSQLGATEQATVAVTHLTCIREVSDSNAREGTQVVTEFPHDSYTARIAQSVQQLRYGPRDWGIEVRFAAQPTDFFPQRPERLWGPPSLLSSGYGSKAAEASNAKVQNCGDTPPLLHRSSWRSAWLRRGKSIPFYLLPLRISERVSWNKPQPFLLRFYRIIDKQILNTELLNNVRIATDEPLDRRLWASWELALTNYRLQV
jgi:hypothetical protein